MLVEIISFFFSPFLTLFDPILSWFTDAFTSQKTQRAAVKSIIIGIVIFMLLSIAFFAYLGFYMIYVPKIAHVKEIYLQYDKGPSLSSVVDFTESGQYRRILTSDQAYDVSIDLVVPASDTNIQLGNFMVGLKLWSDTLNDTVAESNRPCILKYQSRLLRISSTIWRLVPLILGLSKEDQMLQIPMLENIIERSDAPITKAFVYISNNQLNTYDAKIRLDAHFRGLRFFMYYYPVSTAMSFVLLFLFWEIFFSIVAWKTMVSKWSGDLPAGYDANTQRRISAGPVSGGDNQGTTGQNLDGDNRVSVRNNGTIERREGDRVLTTEAESEYESSRPGSIISPITETGDNTESAMDDDDSQSTDEGTTETEVENDDTTNDEDEEEHEGNITPTRSTPSGVSEVNSDEEGPSVGTSTGRLPIVGSRVFRRNGSGAGVESNDE